MSSSRLTSEVPRAIDGTGCMVETTPSCRAVATTRSGPTVWARRTAAVLTEWANASERVIEPRNFPSKFTGCQSLSRTGRSSISVARPPAGLQRRQVDERLERRARLAARGDRAVERPVPMVAPAHHGAHRPAGVEHHRRRLVDPVAHRGLGQRPLHRLLGRLLHPPVQRGEHDQVALGLAQMAGQPVQHPVDEPGADRLAFRRQFRGLGARGLGLRRRDVALRLHPPEHHRRPLARPVEIAGRRQGRGCLEQARQHRGLGQRHVVRTLAEVAPRRRLHPVGAGAQIDPVQVEGEDLVLVEPGLEPDRQRQLLQLAAQRALGREVEVLGQLLRDRAAAGHHRAGPDIVDQGADQADRVDAEMVTEAPVLGRDHRLRPARARSRPAARSGRHCCRGSRSAPRRTPAP